MKGVGSFGQRSSSTLSPLAPPFTVPKPKPSYLEDPYDFEFRPYLDNWLHSYPPTSLSYPFSHPNFDTDSIRASYSYFGSQSVGSHKSHLPSLIHSFPYDQQSKAEPYYPQYSLVEVEPYYPQYPFAIHGDSSSVIASLDGPSQTDYACNLSDFSYLSMWANPWSATFDGDSKGKAVSSNFRNPIQKGSPASESFMAHEEPLGVWHGKCVESFVRKVHIGSEGISSEWVDAKCSSISGENTSIPRTSAFASSPVLQELPYSQLPDTVSLNKPWNPFYTAYDRCFEQVDSCNTDPIVLYPSSFSLDQGFGSPGSGACLSFGSMSQNMNCVDKPVDSSIIHGDSVDDVSANVKEGKINLNTEGNERYANTSRIGNDMKRNDQIFVDSSPTKTDLSLNQKPVIGDHLGHSQVAKFKLKITTLSIPNTSTFAPSTSGLGDSAQSSEAFDQYNQDVDSPCWKGTLGSRHSPFGFEEVLIPLLPIKQLEGGNDFSQHTGSLEEFSSIFPKEPLSDVTPLCSESKFTHADKTRADCSKVCNENGTQSSNQIQEPRNDYMVSNIPKRSFELRTSDSMPLTQEENVVNSTRIADPGTVSNSATQDGSSGLFPRTSRVTVSTEVTELNGAADISSDHSIPDINAPVLIKMIHSLSELLVFSKYSDVNELKEQDYEVLQLVIDNLDAFLTKKVGLVSVMSKAFPELGSSYSFRKPTDLHRGSDTGSSLVPVMEAHKKESRSHEFVLASGDMDLKKNNGITQDAKMVLKEKMSDERENHHQTLLYKNLWIESEAALCSMKYELQLVKIEMEKNKQDKAQDSHTLSDAAGK
ncbi:uncharacterized protein LOC143885340 [Tasmannia lanceolata]|uniref:uncharacterized protein LOC143885340 n=1 Tax=Tasmannia lanceolata TaxID=3420 RepID=UPI004062B64C